MRLRSFGGASMKLHYRVDDFGVLWLDNPVVTVREQFVKGLGVFAGACWIVAVVLLVAT